MQPLNDVGIFGTLFSVKWPMPCLAFFISFLCLRINLHLAAKKAPMPTGATGHARLAFYRRAVSGFRSLACSWLWQRSVLSSPFSLRSRSRRNGIGIFALVMVDRLASPAPRWPVKSAERSPARPVQEAGCSGPAPVPRTRATVTSNTSGPLTPAAATESQKPGSNKVSRMPAGCWRDGLGWNQDRQCDTST